MPKQMLHPIGQPGRQHGVVSWQSVAVAIPPNFFGISFGLGGLAGVWRSAATFFALPMRIGDILYVIAATIFFLLLAA